ncbi:MAG: Na/Pi cotransporter family protein [Clostridia bacterium]|nr:Na/Pi cotransporter family protein [Clostridia bacterium]
MKFVLEMLLPLLCGLALFLFGMDLMGDSLKKSAGSGLKAILGKMTSNPVKGFLLGLIVTCIIQSSSATTVMVVGFVNSGTMTLLQAVGVIMGANVGTAITAWILSLSSLGGGAEGVVDALALLKPDSWVPIVAVVAICLIMFTKRGKKRDIGFILIGFVILMTGMDMMSDAVSGLKNEPAFVNILTMFNFPLLGLMAGMILTAIVQSSSASVGILQALSVTGSISFGMAIPIILGQNIGTCITAVISSMGATKNGKRAALIHLYFNIIGVTIVLSGFYLINWIVGGFKMGGILFTDNIIDMWGIAAVHTIFKLISVAIISPFYRLLEKLARVSIKDSKEDSETANLLDERLINTPAVAVQRATEVTCTMAEISCKALRKALALFDSYDSKEADKVRDLENKADNYEDALGSYLVKVSASDVNEADTKQITKLLHIIGDFERISDHAVNIVESAEEIRDKKLEFSAEAKSELAVLRRAVSDIIDIAESAFKNNNIELATNIEPLEQVVDDLRDKIKLNHIIRLQKSECTIEHGFILADMLNNFERVSDHCSNVGCCLIEMFTENSMDLHKYIHHIRSDSEVYQQKYAEYKKDYSI